MPVIRTKNKGVWDRTTTRTPIDDTLTKKGYAADAAAVGKALKSGGGGGGDCSLLVVTFTTENDTYTPSHTYAQIKEWVDNGGSAVLTDGHVWYNLAVVNASQVWFERTILADSGSQYVRYIITILGKMDKIVLNGEGGGGGINVEDDGAGNVTITSSGSISITDDGDGNVTIF